MDKNDYYSINRDETLAQFFLKEATWNPWSLSTWEILQTKVITSGRLCFKGEINIQKLLHAFHVTLHHFNWIFCRIYTNDQKIYVAYPHDKHNEHVSIKLEIEKFNESLEDKDNPNTLPQAMKSLIPDGKVHPNGLGIAAFKLSLFNNGYVMGFAFNHIFFDRSTIVYFYHFLGRVYSDIYESDLPTLINIKDFFPESNLIEFEKNNDFLQFANSIGFDYAETPKSIYETMYPTKLGPPLRVYFNENSIERIKKNTKELISKADIIQAVHIKIRSKHEDLGQNQSIRFVFQYDIRKYLGLNKMAVGSLTLSMVTAPISIAEANETSLLNLALLNRNYIKLLSSEEVKKQMGWFNQFEKMKQSPDNYFPALRINPLFFGQTNWIKFDYQNISFNGTTPYSVLPLPSPFSKKISWVHYLEKDNERRLAMTLLVSPTIIDQIKQLGLMDDLFTCELVRFK